MRQSIALSLALAVLGSVFADVARADATRAAVVVEGDPSRASVVAARRLAEALEASEQVTLPSDAAVRAALVGEPGSGEDGLEAVRGLRRRIGWSREADREALDTLARQLDLHAVVLVRGGEAPAARVYDARAHRFFEGAAVLDEDSDGSSFVLARLRAAESRRAAEPPSPNDTAAASAEPDTTADVTDSAAGTTEPSEAPARRPWIRRNWPFIVAGALLIGATTFFIVQRDGGDSSPPVIHVRPTNP